MEFKPNLAVKECLDHLAKRLDPIISARLATHLGDHPWTAVLEVLDQKKGFTNGYKYWTYDLQAQLRMLTERLGNLGFPFDDRQRTVSTLGNELRIVRKQMAHMHSFTVDEAYRASDFAVRLLDGFEDAEGLVEAKRFRHEALAALAVQEGVTEQVAAHSVLTSTFISVGAVPAGIKDKAEIVAPNPEMLVREPTFIGDRCLQFEPWAVVPVGGMHVLDDLPKKYAKEIVRSVAVEIASYEGPVHLDRLTEKVAQSFGLRRISSTRGKRIAYQIQQAGLFVDIDKFVWPKGIDIATWAEFRPNESVAERPFTHISPVEVANAARFIVKMHPDIDDESLDAAVLQTFGRKRRTKQLVTHLARARESFRTFPSGDA